MTRKVKKGPIKTSIAGLAQVSGRNNLDWDGKLELDVKYVKTSHFGWILK